MDLSGIDSIKARMQMGILLASVLFGTALLFTLYGIHSVNARFGDFIDQDLKRLQQLQAMQAEGSQVTIATAKKIMVPSLKPPLRVAKASAKAFDAALDELLPLYSPGSKQGQEVAKVKTLWAKVKPQALEAIQQVESGQLDKARNLFVSTVQKDWGRIRKAIQPLIKYEQSRVDATRSGVQEEVSATLFKGMALGLLALVAGVIANFVVGKQVTAAVCETADGLRRIAEGDGDLTQRLQAKGASELKELATNFNTFVSNTQDLIGRISHTTTSMTSLGEKLTGVASATKSNANQQQAATMQVATAMTEMTATVQSVAESAQNAAVAADEAELRVGSGRSTGI